MTNLTKLYQIDSAALRELYQIVKEIKAEDITTAEKCHKVGLTRLRVKLSQVGKLSKEARKDLLEMRDDGKIRRT